MGKIGPTLNVIGAHYLCGECSHRTMERYEIEDGNDYDSGYNNYCTATGERRYIKEGHACSTPDWCPSHPGKPEQYHEIKSDRDRLHAENEQLRARVAELEAANAEVEQALLECEHERDDLQERVYKYESRPPAPNKHA